jgi:predicted N-acetyltransferase YhbS
LSEIRVAAWEDRAAVAALRRSWTEENAGAPVPDDGYEQRFDDWLEREQHQRVIWLVFTRMPRPGGDAGRWGYLANCYVRPQHRNSGLGARLLATCTAYADERGFARVVLSPSPRSVPFYARGGFESATSLMVREPGART